MIDREIMMKPNNPIPTSVCGHCGFLDQKILHHVRVGCNFRRYCTTCVLRRHSEYFCPSCLIVFDRIPPVHAVVCSKCFSSSHRTCVSTPVAGPTTCATCVNPNRLVFDPKNSAIDNAAARLLVTAAEISSMSMRKAEVTAVTEADRRAKDASYTRKKAREALDHVVYLMENEKKNKSAVMPVTNVQISNNKVVAANQVTEALKSVVLKEDDGGIALTEVQKKMRGVVRSNEALGIKYEPVLLVDQEQSPKMNHNMQKNIGLQQ